jgi:hypothetical protein
MQGLLALLRKDCSCWDSENYGEFVVGNCLHPEGAGLGGFPSVV